MEKIMVTLPKKVANRILGTEFTRFVIMQDTEVSNAPMMLIHTSDINSSTLSVTMDHYHLNGDELFIKLFEKKDDSEVMIIPKSIIDRIDIGDYDEVEGLAWFNLLYSMYDFMSKTSSSTSNYTPPFKMVTINEGDNDSNEAD